MTESKFRVSVRINEIDRFMVMIDLDSFKDTDSFILYLCDVFKILPPSPIDVENDELNSLVLVLEPDIIIQDI